MVEAYLNINILFFLTSTFQGGYRKKRLLVKETEKE